VVVLLKSKKLQPSAALTSHWTNIRPADREQARARPIGCWSTPHSAGEYICENQKTFDALEDVQQTIL
jgi:hypothetical protein